MTFRLSWPPRWLVLPPLLAGLLLVGGFFGLRQFELLMSFHPERYDTARPWTMPPNTEDVWFSTSDGVRLHGWLTRTQQTPRRGVVLHFHGNGGSIPGYFISAWLLHEQGFDVMVWDYRGFGRSDGRSLHERTLHRDGEAAHRFITQHLGVRGEDLILLGYSLGTTVATEIAARHGCRALVLHAPVASMRWQVADKMPFLPQPLLIIARSRFETVGRIADVRCPIQVQHGERDDVVSVAQGRAVFNAAREPKRLVVYPDGDHLISHASAPRWVGDTIKFIDHVHAAR